jgi:hypothetical protein
MCQFQIADDVSRLDFRVEMPITVEPLIVSDAACDIVGFVGEVTFFELSCQASCFVPDALGGPIPVSRINRTGNAHPASSERFSPMLPTPQG